MSLGLSQYALPLFIALFGLEKRSLTMSGAVSAIFISYIIILRQNFSWFLILLTFYIIGTVTTKWGSEEKRSHKLMQKVRGPWNVVGNASMALIMALLGGAVGLIGYIGAVATASADTASSEIGVLSKSKPRLITSLKKVPPGTDGGITLLGVFSALVAATVIGLVSVLEFSPIIIVIAAASGLIGHFADSFIGAILEDGAHVGNSTTNFLATTIGSVTAILLYLIII